MKYSISIIGKKKEPFFLYIVFSKPGHAQIPKSASVLKRTLVDFNDAETSSPAHAHFERASNTWAGLELYAQYIQMLQNLSEYPNFEAIKYPTHEALKGGQTKVILCTKNVS